MHRMKYDFSEIFYDGTDGFRNNSKPIGSHPEHFLAKRSNGNITESFRNFISLKIIFSQKVREKGGVYTFSSIASNAQASRLSSTYIFRIRFYLRVFHYFGNIRKLKNRYASLPLLRYLEKAYIRPNLMECVRVLEI